MNPGAVDGAACDDVQHLLVLQVADAVRTVGGNKFPPLCLLAVLFLHRDCAVLGSGQQLAGNRSDAVLFGLKDSHNRPLLSKTNKKSRGKQHDLSPFPYPFLL